MCLLKLYDLKGFHVCFGVFNRMCTVGTILGVDGSHRCLLGPIEGRSQGRSPLYHGDMGFQACEAVILIPTVVVRKPFPVSHFQNTLFPHAVLGFFCPRRAGGNPPPQSYEDPCCIKPVFLLKPKGRRPVVDLPVLHVVFL